MLFLLIKIRLLEMGKMNSSTTELIECVKISKRFGFFFALKNISFEVKPNSIFGILGPNGAGKTTLLKLIAGLLKPSKGAIYVAGLNYDENPMDIKRILGVITDQSFLYEELTIYENLKFYENLFSKFQTSEIKADVERFTKLFNLDEWIDEPVRNLSTGMKRKVEFMRALIHKPQLILIDEVFLGLDVKSIDLLINLIQELKAKESVSFVISTHNIDLALKICDALIVLKRGKINKSVKRDEFQEINVESYF